MSMKYTISHWSDEKLRPQRFDSEDEAWQYIGEHHNCPSCREDIEHGGYWDLDINKKKYWTSIKPSQTLCSAEWDVEPEEIPYWSEEDSL